MIIKEKALGDISQAFVLPCYMVYPLHLHVSVSAIRRLLDQPDRRMRVLTRLYHGTLDSFLFSLYELRTYIQLCLQCSSTNLTSICIVRG